MTSDTLALELDSRQSRPHTLLLGGLTGLTALSIDMSLPAMPQLQKIFNVDVAAAQLTLSLFLLGFAVGQLLCGPLSDRWGRRPVLLGGIALFSFAGLLCALSPSLTMLVLARCLQGVGASVGPILSRAIIRDVYESREAAGVMSQMTQVMIVAPLVAPTLGGFLLIKMGWQAIFVMLACCGALLGLLCWRALPETRREEHLTSGGLAQVAVGFKSVLSHRASLRHILTSCFAYSGMFAYVSGSPFVLIDVFHVPRQNFGIYFALTAICLMIGATVNRALLNREAPTSILRTGVLVIFGAGIAIALAVYFGIGGIAGVILPMMAYLFGQGLVQPNAMAAALEPHGQVAGVASSIMGSLQTAGGALAGFIVGAFFNGTPLSLGLTVAGLAVLTMLAFDHTSVKRAVVLEDEGQNLGLE